MTEITVLSAREIKELLKPPQAIRAMEWAFSTLAKNQAEVPSRIHMDMKTPEGVALFMPAYADGFFGIKTVSLFEDNPKKGLPTIQGTYCLLDGTNGTPLAFMDASALTAIRTGAASGLATDLLAREDSETLAIIGAGIQGRTQLTSVVEVRQIKQVMVYDALRENAELFAEEMSSKLNIPVAVAETPKEAVENADIICTATISTTPVFDDADLKPGAHINAVGSYKPTVQEIPAETVIRARVVVDHKKAALSETGDLIIPIKSGMMTEADIFAELGELVIGKKTGRASNDEITLFKSVGLAIQDLAAATKVYELAKEQGVGIAVDLA